ncbi:hypothetical protein LC55x_3683 [Lysobacter capsici]|nr:hypothetical protein LC55x_3683 [Lysobacter capsici]
MKIVALFEQVRRRLDLGFIRRCRHADPSGGFAGLFCTDPAHRMLAARKDRSTKQRSSRAEASAFEHRAAAYRQTADAATMRVDT